MFKKIFKIWLDFLFPKKCLICEQDNENYLCTKCMHKIPFFDPICSSCKKPSNIGEFCKKCKENFDLRGILIVGSFNNQDLAKLIKSYKYNFIKELKKPLAEFLISFLENKIMVNPILKSFNNNIIPKSPKNITNISTKQNKNSININEFLLIPVPLSKRREKWRGFNQSELLVDLIGKKLNIKISKELIRTKSKVAQVKLDSKNRKDNLMNCFKWTGPNLEDQKIIILDDVYTTGSTLNEIAKELKKHQAREIWGLVLAHG